MVCSDLWWQNSTQDVARDGVNMLWCCGLVAFGGFHHVFVLIQKTSTSFCYLFLFVEA